MCIKEYVLTTLLHSTVDITASWRMRRRIEEKGVCFVYSLSYYPSKPYLLTAGSHGLQVRVWKKEESIEEEEEDT